MTSIYGPVVMEDSCSFAIAELRLFLLPPLMAVITGFGLETAIGKGDTKAKGVTSVLDIANTQVRTDVHLRPHA